MHLRRTRHLLATTALAAGLGTALASCGGEPADDRAGTPTASASSPSEDPTSSGPAPSASTEPTEPTGRPGSSAPSEPTATTSAPSAPGPITPDLAGRAVRATPITAADLGLPPPAERLASGEPNPSYSLDVATLARLCSGSREGGDPAEGALTSDASRLARYQIWWDAAGNVSASEERVVYPRGGVKDAVADLREAARLCPENVATVRAPEDSGAPDGTWMVEWGFPEESFFGRAYMLPVAGSMLEIGWVTSHSEDGLVEMIRLSNRMATLIGPASREAARILRG